MRLALLLIVLGMFAPAIKAQENPASALPMNLGPIDGESDGKSSVVTIRYDSKPGFAKPQVEAHGSFLQIILPHTIVLKPGLFIEGNSPYIRKIAAFQIDEETAGVRLFVTKEAAHLLPAITADILENRVVVNLDHEKAEKELAANFSGTPITGPSPEEIVKTTALRSDLPDPVQLMNAAPLPAEAEAKAPEASAAPAPKTLAKAVKTEIKAEEPKWTDTIETKLIAVTIFLAVMLIVLIAVKSWRKVAVKTLPPGEDFSLKTLATHVLSPKQKISVVQVGGEQFLLGISPDSINFLTTLKGQEAARVHLDSQMFQRSLANAMPQREHTLNGIKPSEHRTRTPENERPVSSKTEPGSSIRYGVDDQGIKNFKSSGPPSAPGKPNRSGSTMSSDSGSESSSLDDVTRLIRKKLKDLPKV